ncbi:acyl-CoA dehydrogenase family protein [Phytohabitans rumicis]|uniref:Oxidoreductase n=1 Tax=Phytohabitans rumicis TaxID=1076125 RepID=A0A6V8L2U2_9ACTN|nr:acyl-CoA dehydrogenase family protein [Phytohabitans rumicis]GFJ91603.1 oxidoreductase [Phytohabitans rumicis]
MSFLGPERETLERLLPGLDKQLAEVPLLELETREGPGIEMFRKAGGPGLVIPTAYNGVGATAVEAVRATRALATRSPSVAIATTMHQFSVASLVALAKASSSFEWMLLDGVAVDGRLVASGFAEGRAGQGILSPTLTARRDGDVLRLSGAKRPCSLSRSMDLLTASVAIPEPDGSVKLGVAMIPAQSEGIRIEPFWSSWVLAGAQSDAVILDDVEVHPDLIVDLGTGLDGELDDLQTIGFVWFELLVTACYLGIAAGLVERVLLAGRGSVEDRARLATTIEGASLMLDGAASNLDAGDGSNDGLGRSLVVRFAVAEMVGTAVRGAVEALGGMAFVSSSEVAYLAAATHAIAFHPPSRHSVAGAMVEWFGGRPLVMS